MRSWKHKAGSSELANALRLIEQPHLMSQKNTIVISPTSIQHSRRQVAIEVISNILTSAGVRSAAQLARPSIGCRQRTHSSF